MQQCIFISEDMPCSFCRENDISEPCIKLWGPRTQATSARIKPISLHGPLDVPLQMAVTNQMPIQLIPSRPLSDYNPSFNSEDLRLLEWVYCNKLSPNVQGPTGIFTLIAKFASFYGASIAHPSLHHAVCAYSAFIYSGPEDDYLHADVFIQRACGVLKQRLNKLPVLDEGDLFVTCLLAMCEPEEPFVHLQGFISFVKFLFEKSRGDLASYTLSAFWQAAGDELVYSIWRGYVEPSVKNCIIAQLSEAFQKVFGNTSFRKDSQPRTGDKTYFCSTAFLATSWQQFVKLKNHLRDQAGLSAHPSFENDMEFFNMLPDIRHHLLEVDEDEVFSHLYANLAEAVEENANYIVRRFTQALHIGASLFYRGLSRLMLVVLEAPLISEGNSLPNLFVAVDALFSMLRRIETTFTALELSFCKCNEFIAEEATEVEWRPRCPLHYPRYCKQSGPGYFRWIAIDNDQYRESTLTWLDFRKDDFLVEFSGIWHANYDIFELLFIENVFLCESFDYNGWLTGKFKLYITIH